MDDDASLTAAMRDAQARLQRIDAALAARADAAAADPSTQAWMAAIQRDRDQLARQLNEMQRYDAADTGAATPPHEGLQGLLERIGLQLEQALTSVLEHGGRRPGRPGGRVTPPP